MSKRIKKVFGSKAIGKALRKHPYGSAAALLALGSLASSAVGRSGSIDWLKAKAKGGIDALKGEEERGAMAH